MTYKPHMPGERGRLTETYDLRPTGYLGALGAPPPMPGGFPAFPGGLPGPVSRAVGPIGPTMSTSVFPTNTRVGDVVTITGPFGGLMQGQVRVKFEGAPWISPEMIGPATASVVVPAGARTGMCEVEINGRRVFGTTCVITGGVPHGVGHGKYSVRAWNHGGRVVRSNGMGYITMGDDVSLPLIERQRVKFASALNPRLTATELRKRMAVKPLETPGLRVVRPATMRTTTKVSASRPRVQIMTAQPISEPQAQPTPVLPPSTVAPSSSTWSSTATPLPSYPEAEFTELAPEASPAAPTTSSSRRYLLWGALAAGAAYLYYKYGRK